MVSAPRVSEAGVGGDEISARRLTRYRVYPGSSRPSIDNGREILKHYGKSRAIFFGGTPNYIWEPTPFSGCPVHFTISPKLPMRPCYFPDYALDFITSNGVPSGCYIVSKIVVIIS